MTQQLLARLVELDEAQIRRVLDENHGRDVLDDAVEKALVFLKRTLVVGHAEQQDGDAGGQQQKDRARNRRPLAGFPDGSVHRLENWALGQPHDHHQRKRFQPLPGICAGKAVHHRG
jgi:hypothetical protein